MSKHLKYYDEIRTLRSKGLTYHEINQKLGLTIPKSTLSGICSGIVLSDRQLERITQLSRDSLVWKRQKAVIANKKIFNKKVNQYKNKNMKLAEFVQNRPAKLVALAMLYLGEGAKWNGRRGMMLGSSNPTILQLYIRLLNDCFGIDKTLLKARIQHRADQDSNKLVEYWSAILGIPPHQFYPCYIDKRTIGKPTLRKNYHGVCSIMNAGTAIQLELEQIVGIINEALAGSSYNG